MSEQKSRGALHGISSHCKVCGDRASGKHYGEKMNQIEFIDQYLLMKLFHKNFSDKMIQCIMVQVFHHAMAAVVFSNAAFDGQQKNHSKQSFFCVFSDFFLKCQRFHLVWFNSSRNLEYTCKEGGKCIVDVSRRNQCQACRFAKCLSANMRPEGKTISSQHLKVVSL